MFVVIENRIISIINHIYSYTIYCEDQDSFEEMLKDFDTQLENKRIEIEKEIKGLKMKAQKQNVGEVVEVGDGVARIEGLSGVQYSELIDFGSGVTGLALNLEQYNVGAVIFGDFTKVKEIINNKRNYIYSQISNFDENEEFVPEDEVPFGELMERKVPLNYYRIDFHEDKSKIVNYIPKWRKK